MKTVLPDCLLSALCSSAELKGGQQRSTAPQDWLQSYLSKSAGDAVIHVSRADLRSVNYKA